ncbi:MAG: YceI family protein [Bacteriovoracaceae bacterium]|nr:YceI family protein [Bacteriovoracaceae bacterium]
MKHLILITFFALFSFASNASSKTGYEILTKKSNLKWTGKKVTGKHFGSVELTNGKLEFEGDDLKGGQFEIDMTSIKVEDITNKEWNTKLENHLKNDDFFSVTKHKTAKVVIKDVIFGKGGVYNVTADLTIKGITKPVLFDATVTKKKGMITANAKIVFNRTLWDVKYKSGKFFKDLGDKLIYDDVEIEVKLVAKSK